MAISPWWSGVVVAQQGSPAVSTGEWIVIGLTVFLGTLGLVFAGAEAVIAWKAYRRPATTITPGFWKVERFSSSDASDVLQVSGTVNFSPMGTSFQMVDAKCQVSADRNTANLNVVEAHKGDVHQGGKQLEFLFREPHEHSLIPRRNGLAVDVEVWIRLADGSKIHSKQKQVVVAGQVIAVPGVMIELPARTPTQMVKFAFNRHIKSPIRRRLTAIWHHLRHDF